MKYGQSSTYSNAFDAQRARDIAIQKARNVLKQKGLSYPTKTPNMSVIEYYDAVSAYGLQEAALITKFLQPKAEPRPIIEFGKPYREWSPFND